LLVEHVVAINRTLADSRKVSIELEVKDPAATVTADPVKLIRALEALLTTAIRSSRADGRIELRVELAGGNVVITIGTDNSVQSSDLLRSLFNPALGQRGKRKFAEQWAALTLTYAKSILEVHQGSVRIEDGEKGKSSVVISLPASERIKRGVPPKSKTRKGTKASSQR
jgi:signal transduction histidine kinase